MNNILKLDYQEEAIEKIKSLDRNIILRADCGLGKTYIALNIMKRYRRVLFLTLPSLVHQTQKEIDKFSLNYITCSILSYNVFHKRYEQVEAFNPDLIILDEAHVVNSFKSKRAEFFLSKVLYKKNYNRENLLYKKRILMMTATPATKNIYEWYALLKLAGAKVGTKRAFVTKYCGWVHNYILGYPQPDTQFLNQDEFKESFKDYFINLERDKISYFNQGGKITKEYFSTPFPWEGSRNIPFQTNFKNFSQKNALYIKDNFTFKPYDLIVYKFNSTLEAFRYREDFYYINGEVSPPKRNLILKKFNQTGNKKALLAQQTTVEFGLNIARAKRIIFIDKVSSPEVEKQIIYRAYRLNRKEDLTVINIKPAKKDPMNILNQKRQFLEKTYSIKE